MTFRRATIRAVSANDFLRNSPVEEDAALPSGAVTFLFTDIQGSTPLFQEYPDDMPHALARHHAILQAAITARRGRVFQVIGDAFCAVFVDPTAALQAALDAQHALHAEPWGQVGTLRVRMGLHTGTAEAQGDDYLSSLTLVRVQRIMSAGHGGQILLSGPTGGLVRDSLPPGVTLRDLGANRLRGLSQPEQIYQLVAADLPAEFAPLRVVESPSAEAPAALLEQLVRGQLVGRQAELAQLRQHWDSSQQARAHLVLLSGEPGIGKTRLALELIAHASAEGAEVLRGGCYEYEAMTPYLPIAEAIRDWVHRQSPESLRTVLGTTAYAIAKLAPEIEDKLGALPPAPVLPASEDRLRFFDNVVRFVQTLAAPHGLLLFLDDLHWADQGTLNLLHYLLRHLRNDRVLILAAYREMELDRAHPLATAWVEWNRERLATRISLGRLSRNDTGTLLATLFGQSAISDEFTQVLYRETEGNPFFIEEVIKALIEQGQIYREDGGWGRTQADALAIPQSVKEAIGRRLDRLSGTCTEVLRTAAGLGKVFSFAELAAVSRLDEDGLLDALDEAIAAQLVRTDTEDTFSFTHDKIREVLYEELNPIRRRRLHQRLGDKLEELYHAGGTSRVRIQDLAYHFIESGDLPRALTYSRQAGENAARLFALDEALSYYERAGEAAEALGDDLALADVAEAMGDLHSLRGDIPAAVAQYNRAAARVTMPRQLGPLHAKIGRDYGQVGDARGAQFLEMAVTELDPATQANELALATASLGRYHHYHAQHHRALEFLNRALAIAEPLDDVITLNYIYSYLAGAYQHLARYQESMDWARRLIALGERKNFPTSIATGNEFLGEDSMELGDWPNALRYAAQDYQIGARVGAQDRVAWAQYVTGWAQHGMGGLAHAEVEARASLELAERLADARLVVMAQALLGQVLSDRGAFSEARAQAQQALERSDQLQHLFISVLARYSLGYIYLRMGEAAAALESLERADALLAPTDNQWMRLLVGPQLSEAYLATGRAAEALETARAHYTLAETARSRHWQGLSLSAQARALTAIESFDEAESAFAAAIELFEMLGSRLELARAYYFRAELWRARGDSAEGMSARAAQDEQRAHDLFLEGGAALPGGMRAA